MFNSGAQTVTLGGWLLDDEADEQAVGPEGSAAHVIPADTLIEPGGLRVFLGRTSGVVLNNDRGYRLPPCTEAGLINAPLMLVTEGGGD